jgi:hypothetical protein
MRRLKLSTLVIFAALNGLALNADAVEATSPLGNPASGPRLCRLQPAGPEYYKIWLRPTGPGPQAVGEVDIAYTPSPFGLAVTGDGRYAQDARIVVRGLPQDPTVTYVVWVAPPNLSAVRKLGAIKNDTEMKERIDWNKFLIFVSAEPDPSVERWKGKILLTGISRSGLMHTFAGHGPFESALC